MEPFRSVPTMGWEADVEDQPQHRARARRWLTAADEDSRRAVAHAVGMRKAPRRARRALQALAIYVRLTEWYEDDLGVLELK